ncbi:hypothetical protein ACHHYP_20796 [Achlya hypogyna]|uniref:Helicase-associated domain-containing protein n=1 Tax=Achlya hypogyna TaxID=1202772 RepID=A0A1V9Y9F5_ACHHY|nr:hypothetical protein ACHHYP_20796 [Achlya hypogyna]
MSPPRSRRRDADPTRRHRRDTDDAAHASRVHRRNADTSAVAKSSHVVVLASPPRKRARLAEKEAAKAARRQATRPPTHYNISRPARSPSPPVEEAPRAPTAAERQQIFVNLVRIAHFEQRPKSDYTTLPGEFTVPAMAPWPASLWGTLVDVDAFRRAHADSLLQADVVAQLEALRFVWDPFVHQWHLHVAAFQRYKLLYGDLCIPHAFEIPDEDKRWPKDVWKVALGLVAHNLRHNASALPPVREKQLSALGFIWDVEELQWRTWHKTLQTFYRLYGHVDVPLAFCVPDQDPAWTPDAWQEKLGEIVAALRTEAHVLSPERRWQLDELGFNWGPAAKKRRSRAPVPHRAPKPLPRVHFVAAADAADRLGAFAAPRFPMFGDVAQSTVFWDDYGQSVELDDMLEWPRVAHVPLLHPMDDEVDI